MDTPDSDGQTLRFGPFELDPKSLELRKDGIPTRLQPQPARVLALLVRNPGRVVTREEIRRQIWGEHTFVDFEQGLNFCVRQIRTALGDDAETPRYIETLPRRGYRFIAQRGEGIPADVTGGMPRTAHLIPYLKAPSTWGFGLFVILVLIGLSYLAWQREWIRPRNRTGRIFIAVLPFQNLGGDREQEYLSDGLTEEMITRLGGYNPELMGVIASTSAMQYKGSGKGIDRIARELGVDYVLEGSLRRAGNRVRISAQLIRARDQTHLWAQTYERNLEDVLALQADVARAIAGEISLRFKGRGGVRPSEARPIKPEAYEAYLKGRYFCRSLTGGGVEKGTEYLKRSIALEPGYAPAHAALAEAYYALSNMQLNPREAMTLAKASAARALELNDSLAEAHAALGLVMAFYEWEWQGAEREFRRALDLDPSWAGAQGWYGAYLALMGRLEESKAELERARRLDPLSLSINLTMGLPLYLERRYDLAADRMHKTLELDPDFYLAHVSLGLLHETRAEFDKAIAEYQKAGLADDSPEILAYRARAFALSGREGDAEAMIAQLEAMAGKRYVSPYDVALVYAGLDRKKMALAWLQKAYEGRAEGMVNLKTDPRLDGLRPDPAFQDLLRRMNFPR